VADLYFAYGSNMSSARIGARLTAPVYVCTARITGYRLAFNKPGRDGTGKANLVPDAEGVAWGVVWRIAVQDWPRLDGFEPGYARRACVVEGPEGDTRRVHVYLHAERGPDVPPHAWYVQHVIDGAREHGLPEVYVESIARVHVRAADTDALRRRDGEPGG
jgi:hypothetical protein